MGVVAQRTKNPINQLSLTNYFFFFYFSLFKKIVLKARFYETLKDYINLFPTLTYQEVDLEFWVLEISRKAVFDGVKRMPRTDGLLLQVILSTVSSGAAI